ncbi:MAG: addiction module protein [Planctomycetota bacterium]
MKFRREDIQKLSIPERIQLVEDIWDSIAEASELLPVTDAQRKDLDRRREEYRKNLTDTRTWSEVRERLEGDQ